MTRAIGSRVITTTADPSGHNRLPRYLRGKPGRIEATHGDYPLADRLARGESNAPPETLYTVAFAARDVWDRDAAPGDVICAELWESYFERD